jgi:hypothetical protein
MRTAPPDLTKNLHGILRIFSRRKLRHIFQELPALPALSSVEGSDARVEGGKIPMLWKI